MKLSDRKTFHSVIPYSTHVVDSVVKTINNDFVATWVLAGTSFECDSVLDSDIVNEQTHTFLKSFSSENVTFYTHIVRQSWLINLIADQGMILLTRLQTSIIKALVRILLWSI